MIEQTQKDQLLTADETEAISPDAHRIVDGFQVYERRRNEAFREYDAWEKRHDEATDKRHDARDAVLSTPAPDHGAVLLKLDLLSETMEGEQDCDHVEAIRADTRRLLTGGRS